MSKQTLEQLIQQKGNPVDLLRQGKLKAFPEVKYEYTHWIEEQRAWRETCSLADLSHHMTDLIVEGPDALGLFSELGTNDFRGFDVGHAKQFVACNPDGFLIGDGILFNLGEDRFNLVGIGPANNWVQYNIEIGDYDVSFERDDDSVSRDGPPKFFRYQIQGPNAYAVMDEVSDEPIPDIPFFNFGRVSIDGHDVNVLRHGMAGEAGFEFWGPWEIGETVKETVMAAGEDYGIRHLGTKSYQSAAILGWVAIPVPAVFGEGMSEYREWLEGDSFEANFSIGGSFVSGDISDYYVTPAEVGYDQFINFEHDFIGRDRLKDRVENQRRELVTLVWDDEDVINVYASLFRDGLTHKFMDLPAPRWGAAQYDEVRYGNEIVGVSKLIDYDYNERTMLSLGIIDTDFSNHGTELSLRWGLEGAPNPNVERHLPTDIRVTTAPVPYAGDRRR